MFKEKKMEQSELVDAGCKSDVCTIIDQEGALRKGIQADATSSQSYSGTVIPAGNECNENLNQLGGRSGSNKDVDLQRSRTMPSESCNSAYVCDPTNSTTDASRRDNSMNFRQNKNLYQYATSKSITKPHFNAQPLRSSNQLSSGYRSATQSQSQRKFPSFSENNKGGYCARNSGLNYSPNARTGNGSDRLSLKEKPNMHGEIEAMADLTCGPRGQRRKSVFNIPAADKRMWLSVRREEYNLEDFQTEYDNAKFYVIKPISEDDTHKSMKYNVWSSTPCGNTKLDAAFRDSQNETSEEETICPIFLFFSVIRSGQFVGLAEMIGKVDFAKNLNFWQSDKWNGFFPVKWHIIKDIPYTQLRHIIIENNDNEPVTHTRDTKEIGFQHGLEMLKIFKNYTAKTSLLDDFNFYEKREHSLRAKRNNLPAIQKEKHERVGERTIRGFTTNNFSDSAEPIIRRTQKALNSRDPKLKAAVINLKDSKLSNAES